MVHSSELSGLTNKKNKHITQKMAWYKNWTENEGKKTLKDLQKAWKTIAQDHFKRIQESLAAWKEI